RPRDGEEPPGRVRRGGQHLRRYAAAPLHDRARLNRAVGAILRGVASALTLVLGFGGAARAQDPHDALREALTVESSLVRAPHPRLEGYVTNRSLYTDRKSTRLNSSHVSISYAVFCLKKKN